MVRIGISVHLGHVENTLPLIEESVNGRLRLRLRHLTKAVHVRIAGGVLFRDGNAEDRSGGQRLCQ